MSLFPGVDGAGVVPVAATGSTPRAAGGAPALSWWNPDGATPSPICDGAYQAKAAASYAASKVNLPTPGINDLTEGNGAVTWAAGVGWTLVAAQNKYFDTGILPIPGTGSALIQVTNIITNTAVLFGSYSNNPSSFLIQPRNGGVVVRYWSGNWSQVAPVVSSGNLGMAGKQGYRNGAADGAPIPAGGIPSVRTVYVGAYNGGAPTGWFSGDVQAFAIYNVTLTGPQMLARAAAMALL